MASIALMFGTALLAMTAEAWLGHGGVRDAQGERRDPPCATTFDTSVLAEVRVDEIRVEVRDDGGDGVSRVEVRGEDSQRALHAQAGGRRLTFEPGLTPGPLEISSRIAEDAPGGACVVEVTLWSQGALVGRATPR